MEDSKEMNTEMNNTEATEVPEVVVVGSDEVATETALLIALSGAAKVRTFEFPADAAVEILRDASQRLSELQAAIEDNDFDSKKAAMQGFAEYREILLRMRGVVNSLRMHALDVRPDVLSAVGAARKAGSVDVAERKVQEAVFMLAKTKIANGKELTAYEQSVYDMLAGVPADPIVDSAE